MRIRQYLRFFCGKSVKKDKKSENRVVIEAKNIIFSGLYHFIEQIDGEKGVCIIKYKDGQYLKMKCMDNIR